MNGTTITRKEDRAIVQPGGDVVAAHVPELRSALRQVIGQGVREMTLDFSQVRMVDSTGLGLLISAHNSVHKAGGSLSVIHASQDILDLFQSMRIHQHFRIAGDDAQ